MGIKSNISWTRSTLNYWIGCTKVGAGCDSCYAEVQDSRKRWGGVTHWGPGVPRHLTSESNRNAPKRWDKLAAEEQRTGILTPGPDWKANWTGPIGFWPVFCSSLADVFDNEVPEDWRIGLFKLIQETPHLTWQLVTKRIGNAAKMLPDDWDTGYPNVWIIATIVNQEEAERDLPKLLSLPAAVRGVSYEPALGPVDWTPYFPPHDWSRIKDRGEGFPYPYRGVEWIIIGGESVQGKHEPRPFMIEWARDTIEQCQKARVPVWVKQLGSNARYVGDSIPGSGFRAQPQYRTKDRAGADPTEWPSDLNVQQFPTTKGAKREN